MADTLDVIDIETARSSLGVQARYDSLLAVYITAVSRKLDDLCGPIVRRTITDELHDGGAPIVQLRHGPVYSFTSVVEAQGTTSVTLTMQTFATAPAEGYIARAHRTASAPYSGLLERVSGGLPSRFYAGTQTVKATYSGGRFADTASVDDRFTQAALMCLRNLWRNEQGQVVPTPGELEVPTGSFARFTVPNAVKELLWDEMRLPGLA